MRLALVVGDKQGQVIKKRLEGIKDNLNIDIFNDVPRYIDLTYKKNIIYDRVLVISTLLNKRVMTDLYNFWGNTSKDTQVIVMGKKGKDNDLASAFLNLFQSPVVAVMLVDNTTVQLIAEAVLLKPKDINDKYGVQDYLTVETGEDEIVIPENLIQTDEPDVKEPKKPVEEPKKQVQQQPQKKGGLFGGLFGGKKNKNSQPQQTNQPVEESQSEEQFSDEGSYEDTYNENYSDNYGYDNSQDDAQNYDNNTIDNEIPYQDSYSQEQTEDYTTDNLSDNFENSQTNEDLPRTPDQNNTDSDFTEDNEDSFDFGVDTSDNDVQSVNSQQDYSYQSQPMQEVDEDFGSQGTFVDEDFGMEEYDTNQGTNDFDNDAVEVEEDFGNDTVSYEGNTQNNRHSIPNRNITTVDDDFTGMNVASAEEAYRQQNEQPKVITKTVVKEVVRDSGRGTINAIKGVISGKTHKIIIVTGDRATGITTTALNIAKQFSAKVPILYFDCDVDNHGLLSYINYDNFRDYENTHMQGVKLATNGKAFRNCACKFEDNFDLLTTDYSCDVTDEEIETAGTTVAEVSGDYGVVVVDCPLDKLHLISDLIMIGNTVLCVEGSKRGFMNMLCRLENSPLPMRYKRAIVSKGTMFITKCNSKTDLGKLKKYINNIFMPTGADWMSMESREFNGKLNDNILNSIIE